MIVSVCLCVSHIRYYMEIMSGVQNVKAFKNIKLPNNVTFFTNNRWHLRNAIRPLADDQEALVQSGEQPTNEPNVLNGRAYHPQCYQDRNAEASRAGTGDLSSTSLNTSAISQNEGNQAEAASISNAIPDKDDKSNVTLEQSKMTLSEKAISAYKEGNNEVEYEVIPQDDTIRAKEETKAELASGDSADVKMEVDSDAALAMSGDDALVDKAATDNTIKNEPDENVVEDKIESTNVQSATDISSTGQKEFDSADDAVMTEGT